MQRSIALTPRSLALLAGLVLACLGAGRIGSLLTLPHLEPWYRGLAKPAFNPPDWAFPLVWTILFIVMAVALWRVLLRAENRHDRNAALAAFAVQLLLNVGWSYAFFGNESPAAGLLVIAALIGAIVLTIATFRRIDALAAALLLPYLVWVAYAAVLNASIWLLNR